MKPSPDKFNINKMAGVILFIKKEVQLKLEQTKGYVKCLQIEFQVNMSNAM